MTAPGPLLALLLLAISVSFGCALSNSEAAEPEITNGKAEDTKADDRIAVAAFPLGRGRIESVLRFSANLEAESAVEVYSESERRVVELLVEEGNRVQKGQLMLRLEDDEQRSSMAMVKSQLAKAEREFERQRSLFEKQLISEQAFNEATYSKEQLEIALGDAERALSYTEVRAPISGIVTQRLVNVGDYIRSNEHLFDLVDFDSIVARVFVPETEMSRLAKGQRARLTAQATEGSVHEAFIDRIAPVVDPRSGTVKVTLAVPAGEGLVPGMYVEVELVAQVEENALLVPKRALVYDQDQTFVFRVGDENRVERLMVKPLIQEKNFITVAGDVAEDDRIVIAGQAGLKDGAEVRLLDLQEALATFGDGSESIPANF